MKKIIEIAKEYIGAVEGDSKHKYIIDDYNFMKPKGGYTMTYGDPWCAAFVSVCAARAGTGLVMSCNTEEMKSNLRNDIVKDPEPGGLVFFDWNGDGVTDHVGIVCDVMGDKFTTIEGNTSNSVAMRSYSVNDPNINCFTCDLENGDPTIAAQIYENIYPKVVGDGNGKKQLFYPQIQYDMTNDYVDLLKCLLSLHGYTIQYNGPYFDEDTVEQLKKFQDENAVAAAPGVCGINTWRALIKGDYEIQAVK